jgi:outer membrane receptor protein involved in Fe transport
MVRQLYPALLAGAVFGLASAALAQDAPAADAQPQTASAVEEIIVTATKRATNIQEVPIAVTALTDVQLERTGIRDIRDLPALSPSFNMNSSNTTTGGTTLRIRGVGTTGNNAGLESAVGVFLDGVYFSRPGIALGDLLDVEAVEVLRGPQGTLFGRNTSAGALHIRTKRPDLSEVEAWANASVGNYSFLNIQAGTSIPLIEDVLAARFSMAWRQMDGYMKSTTGAESHDKDRYLLRGQLLWAPTEDIDFRLIADYAKVNEHCCDAAISYDPAFFPALFTASGLPADGGAPAQGHDAVGHYKSNAEEFEERTQSWGFSGELTWDLGEVATLTSLTAYRRFENGNTNPSHYTNLDVYNFPRKGIPETNGFGTEGENSVFSQEIRLQGTMGEWFDWLVGFYYSDEEIKGTTTGILGSDYTAYTDANLWRRVILPATASGVLDAVPLAVPSPGFTTFGDVRLFGVAGGSPGFAFGGSLTQEGEWAANYFRQDGRSWSIFTHNTFHATDWLDLTFGLRWIDERKDGKYDQLDGSSPACRNIAANGNVLAAFSPALGNGIRLVHCFFLTTEVGFPGATAAEFDGPRFEDDELAYTASVGFKITEWLNAYVGYSHGFKAGGYNLDTTAALGGSDPRFLSEEVDAIEGGVKALLFDRTRANMAVFHQEMDDFQVLEFTGTRFETFNVQKVKATGVEVETTTSVLDGLELLASFTYANSRYPDDCHPPTAPPLNARSLCGNLLTNSPKYSGVVGFNWEDGLPWGELTYFVNTSMRLESRRRTSTQWRNPGSLPATVLLVDDWEENNEKVNMRVGVSGAEGRWTVELWASNLFDKTTKNVTFNTPLRGGSAPVTTSRGVFVEAPRLYGATLRLQY